MKENARHDRQCQGQKLDRNRGSPQLSFANSANSSSFQNDFYHLLQGTDNFQTATNASF